VMLAALYAGELGGPPERELGGAWGAREGSESETVLEVISVISTGVRSPASTTSTGGRRWRV
jgi:hypothetical protein